MRDELARRLDGVEEVLAEKWRRRMLGEEDARDRGEGVREQRHKELIKEEVR
jgi:hypothetical protein